MDQTSVEHGAEPDAEFLKEISTATVLKLLLKKGILTCSEILQQERELRLQDSTYETGRNSPQQYEKSRTFRTMISKKRWSRRLATLLFGWEWKKTRHEKTQT